MPDAMPPEISIRIAFMFFSQFSVAAPFPVLEFNLLTSFLSEFRSSSSLLILPNSEFKFLMFVIALSSRNSVFFSKVSWNMASSVSGIQKTTAEVINAAMPNAHTIPGHHGSAFFRYRVPHIEKLIIIRRRTQTGQKWRPITWD